MILIAEIALISAAVCGAHRLRGRLGPAPMLLLVGLLEAFLFVVGKPSISITAEMPFGEPRGIYTLFLPSILVAAVVLVYVLEGSREARRLIAAMVLLYFAHGVIDVIVEYHASNPPPGKPYQGKIDLVWYDTGKRAASLVAMVVDFVVVIVLYQFLRNRVPWLPLAVPIFLGLVVGLVTDAAVYKLIAHGTLSWESFHVTAKAQAGVAAGLPAALYCALELRRRGGVAPEGGLERRALELVDLRRRISTMAQELAHQQVRYKDIKDTFRRYVSPDVVDTIMEDPSRLELGGEVRDVTILFADIRGYSTLAEALDPTEIITLLNVYFERVSAEILGNRGMINEFEGDGVLAVFGAPLAKLEAHADCAVRAGLGMLRSVEELNVAWAQDGTTAKWNAVGIDGLAIRVGIHSGPVVAGNVGSQARTKYAVIGDTVNTAARVEGLNKVVETSLLITQATLDAMRDDALRARFADRGTHPLKGRLEPVRVYTPQT